MRLTCSRFSTCRPPEELGLAIERRFRAMFSSCRRRRPACRCRRSRQLRWSPSKAASSWKRPHCGRSKGRGLGEQAVPTTQDVVGLTWRAQALPALKAPAGRSDRAGPCAQPPGSACAHHKRGIAAYEQGGGEYVRRGRASTREVPSCVKRSRFEAILAYPVVGPQSAHVGIATLNLACLVVTAGPSAFGTRRGVARL